MRGVQDTVRPLRASARRLRGVRGALPAAGVRLARISALGAGRLGGGQPGTGQWLAALLFCRALLAEHVGLGPDFAVLRRQVVMGRDLVVRTMAFQACFLSAAAVAARFGAAALAAHQVVLQLWSLLRWCWIRWPSRPSPW